MATKTNIKKHTAGAALFVAVLGSMSGLPGIQGVVQSADLFSRSPLYLNNCPVEDEIGANGISECRVVNPNKVSAQVTVEEVVRQEVLPQNPAAQGSPAPGRGTKRYKVTSFLEADFCSNGECSMERTVGSLEEAIRLGKEFSDKLSKEARTRIAAEKARQARIDKCEIDEEGNEITREPRILKCLTDKLKEMDPEQAAEFYADNLKERIQALLQSKSPNDRALGMGALGQLGKDLNINCATRPGLQVNGQNSQNQFLTHNLLNPQMNPMRPVSTAGTRPGAERNLIAESACDMWAFGSYNNNVEYLQLMAAQPGANRPAIGQALRSLRSGWGTYFQQRGMALNADPLGLNGMSGDLMNDYHENNDRLAASMKAIVDQHKDLLEPTAVQDGALTTAGRGARGGVMPHNPTGPGTPSVNPWPGVAPGIPQGRPGMQPAPVAPGRFGGAPRMGTPVGAPGAPPLRR